MRRVVLSLLALSCLVLLNNCGQINLNALVQPPRFEQAPGQPAEIRLLGPSGSNPLGGAGIRMFAKVTNPNSFGLTVSTLKGTLFLEDARAADTEFPLGLPLGARADSVVPIDVSVSFADVPGLSGAARRVVGGQPLAYRLEGTVGVDAPRIGQGMVFGPMTLLRGEATEPIRFESRQR